ncbi:MAG: PHB depolymerase family esterase [Stagnimonas sp.]|nr:PHB depolymerase family esterase [Stagnimonas sp.]
MRFASALQRTAGSLLALIALVAAIPAQAVSFLPWEHTRAYYEAFEFGGITRSVGFLAPANPQGKVPAVLVLHYNLGPAATMANLTEVGEFARDHGAFVILPEANDLTWSHAPNETNPTDDVGYLNALIDSLVARYPIDPKRIYMTGYSQGGNMTVRFVCEHPEKIAAGAVIAATMRKSLERVCAPSVPTPMMFFNGTADDQVPYEVGLISLQRDLTGVGALTPPDAAKWWADANQCPGTTVRTNIPTTVEDGTSVYVDRYTDCPPNRGAELYTVVEGGHNWPGSLDFVPRTGLTTQNIRANREMWRFFMEHSR